LSYLGVPVISGSGLVVTLERKEGSLHLRLKGTADMSAVSALDDQLAAVHAEAARERLTAVFVDFRDLEFMNSSCFKCLVTWLGNAQDLAEADRYRIVVKSNRDMHWQRRSLNALRSFAADIFSIEASP